MKTKKTIAYLNELKNDLKNLSDKHRQILGRLEAMKYEKERFHKKEQELGAKYGAFQIACPDIFLEGKINEKNSQDKALENLNSECKKLEKEISKLEKDENKLTLELEQKKKDQSSMQDEYSSKKQEEETLRLKAAEICRLDFDDKTYSEEWLQNRSFEIAELKEEKMVNLNELNKELWENNIDLTLNNNDYWIANNDIDTIKLRIEDAGVRVSYGTQFLSILSQDDRKKYLKDYPMLPFSLVIADEEDWKITKNNMPKDILLRNMVSIFIRTEMNGVLPAGYRFIDHKGAEFTENAAVFRQWKESLSKKSIQTSEAIKVLILSIEKMDNVINEINIILRGENSLNFEQKIKEIDDDIKKYDGELSLVKVKINNANDNLNAYEKKAESISKMAAKLDYEIKELQDFIEFKNEIH